MVTQRFITQIPQGGEINRLKNPSGTASRMPRALDRPGTIEGLVVDGHHRPLGLTQPGNSEYPP